MSYDQKFGGNRTQDRISYQKQNGHGGAKISFLERAIKDGYANITGAEEKKHITYVTSDNHSERYEDPEE